MNSKSDGGFSLVEVVMAMFLLAILSLAVLPLLIAGVAGSVTNRDVVVATAIANDRVAALRVAFPTAAVSVKTCAQLTDVLLAMNADPVDGTTMSLRAEPLPDPSPSPTPTASATPSASPTASPAPEVFTCPTTSTAYPRAVLVRIVVSDSDSVLAEVRTRVTVGAK